jgi:membrane-associated phospholipid phosphatase
VSRPVARAILSLLAILTLCPPATSLVAQQADSVGVKLPATPLVDSTAYRPHALKAWEVGAVAAGGVLTIALLDESLKNWTQDPANRGQGADDAATVFKQFGAPYVVYPVAGGIILVGALAHQPAILHAGYRVGASLVLAGATTAAAKLVFGRVRPDSTNDVWDFQPFSGNASMWSGHSALAFAFATSLSQEIHRTWATVGLYALATGTAWSRVYDDEHWTSDVLVGAAVGIASAKLATGRWTIFGLRAPVPLATGKQVGLAWSGTF